MLQYVYILNKIRLLYSHALSRLSKLSILKFISKFQIQIAMPYFSNVRSRYNYDFHSQ